MRKKEEEKKKKQEKEKKQKLEEEMRNKVQTESMDAISRQIQNLKQDKKAEDRATKSILD